MSINGDRMPLAEAEKQASFLSERLAFVGIQHLVCGSIRRKKETVGDLDVVVSDLLGARIALGDASPLPPMPKGKIRRSVNVLFGGLNANLYAASEDEWGAMVLFLSGNHLFNVQMRGFAKAHGYKLNQYGLWHGETKIAGREEKQIFYALGLKYLEPTEREFGPQDRIWKFKEVA